MDIILLILAELAITAIAYLLVPFTVHQTKGKMKKKPALTIAIINSVVVHLIFALISFLIDGSVGNALPAILWGIVSYRMLREKPQSESQNEEQKETDNVSENDITTSNDTSPTNQP